ncbi:MAG: hypothetical protein DRI89_08945 [Bacteroidetes bacterium]|nr:MAG: hypothetical protein DRI89_08945 [Bacteroidota bacterium]
MKENNFHDFFFNVKGMQYDSGNINGLIFYADLTGLPNSADVEYKRLLNQANKFTTTATDGAYQITVPVVYEQANPGQTKYIVTISPNGGDDFVTEIDTVLIVSGSNTIRHYVSVIPENQTQDIEGIVRNVYSKALESGVTVRVINRSTGELIEEDITGSDGKYSFENIPAGTDVEFELGKENELWMINNEHDVPNPVLDTIIAFNRYFYPKTVEVPEVGANSTIEGDGEEIAEMVGTDKINFEEILRDIDYMWANGPGSPYWSARTWIQDHFYEGSSPITTANTMRNITTTMQNDYDPYTNFYPGQLGWNVNFSQGNLTTPILATTTYGVTAIMGGEMMMTDDGTLAPVIKEMQGRRLLLGTVSSRPSMMNATAVMPDSKDRSYVHLILINQNGRFDEDHETYSLENITSVEPSSKAASGMGLKEKPLPNTEYQDLEGNKPHSKNHFNKEKYQEQVQFQRQEQVRTPIANSK